MGLLRLTVALAGVAACYSPDIRDCALACAADSDCVSNQVCTADHWCAAPSLASGCGELAHDAGVDAETDVTADARPDAAPLVNLHIHVDGSGEVDVTNGPICAMVDCNFTVPKDVAVTVTAVPHGAHPFDKWTSMLCMEEPPICTFTPAVNVTVSVKFH